MYNPYKPLWVVVVALNQPVLAKLWSRGISFHFLHEDPETNSGLFFPQDQITSFLSCPHIWNSHKDSNEKRATLRLPLAGVPRCSESSESPLGQWIHSICAGNSVETSIFWCAAFLKCLFLLFSLFLHIKEEKSAFPSIWLEPKIASFLPNPYHCPITNTFCAATLKVVVFPSSSLLLLYKISSYSVFCSH